jgi:hypothetical protein
MGSITDQSLRSIQRPTKCSGQEQAAADDIGVKQAAIHWSADPVTANVVIFYKRGCRVHR